MLLNYALKTCGESCSVEAEYQRRGLDMGQAPFIVTTVKVTRYFLNFAPTIQTYHFNSQGKLFAAEQADTYHTPVGCRTVEPRITKHDNLTLFEAKGLILSIV
jgi:hypothetical protein